METFNRQKIIYECRVNDLRLVPPSNFVSVIDGSPKSYFSKHTVVYIRARDREKKMKLNPKILRSTLRNHYNFMHLSEGIMLQRDIRMMTSANCGKTPNFSNYKNTDGETRTRNLSVIKACSSP